MTRHIVEGDLGDVTHFIDVQGWTDGLPVVPPTEDRVVRMLGDFRGEDSIGAVPPGYGQASNEVLACNAVMAGCAPAMFPVVRAAIQAMLQRQFNLGAIQAT